MGEEQPVQVNLSDRRLNIQPFIAEDPSTRGYAWERWLTRFTRQLNYFKIVDPEDRKNALLIYGGELVEEVEDTQPNPPDPQGEAPLTPYTRLVKKLNDYFLPRKNKTYARYLFTNLKQRKDESILEFSTRVREAAKSCDWPNNDDMICHCLVCGTHIKELRERALDKEWDLVTFMTSAISESA